MYAELIKTSAPHRYIFLCLLFDFQCVAVLDPFSESTGRAHDHGVLARQKCVTLERQRSAWLLLLFVLLQPLLMLIVWQRLWPSLPEPCALPPTASLSSSASSSDPNSSPHPSLHPSLMSSSSSAESSLRALLAKMQPLSQPLQLKIKLMQTMMARTIAAATSASAAGEGGADAAGRSSSTTSVAIAAPASPASSSCSSAAHLFALVHSLCAVGEEWMSSVEPAPTAFEGSAPQPEQLNLQCACGAAVLSSLASPIAATTASPVTARAHLQMRAAFVSYYSRDHMRSLVPPMPWHQDASVAPAAFRLIALVLRLLTPLLPPNELVYRMQAVRECLQFLLAADPPPASLVPHPAVSCSLAQLWIHAPDTCPDAPRMRMDLAVRWLCMLPSNPPTASEAERTRLTKEALVQFIAQPWLAAPASDDAAAPASSGSDFTPADKQALDTLETVFVLQMGAPLLALESGQPSPLPAIYAADLIRTIPLRYTAAASERARMFALAVKPAILMPPVLHPAGGSSAAPSSLVVPGLPTESNLIAAMLSMIDWGLDPRIEPWVSALVDGICLASKFDLLRHFATTYAHSHILSQLLRSQTRAGAFHLLRKLLLGDSTQPAAFLSCVNGLVKVTEGLKKECEEAAAAAAASGAAAAPASTSSSSSSVAPSLPFLRSYSLLLRSLMYCHTGHPTEYVPLVEALNQLELAAASIYAPAAPAAATAMDTSETQVPPAVASASFTLLPSEREMMEEQKRGAWVGAAAAAASSSGAASGALSWSARAKSSTGKTGLDNLGNSCYLNSVLQSLFMTDAFRRALLGIQRAKVGYAFIKDHPILTNLQSIFGFLLLSNRASYAPHTLFKALPDMFRDATQQDAGEFAKFVLDSVGASLKKLRELQSEQAKAAAAAAANAGVSSNAPTAPSTPASATSSTPIDGDVSMSPPPQPQPLLASSSGPHAPPRSEPMQAITLQTRDSSQPTPMDVEHSMKGGSMAATSGALASASLAPDSMSTAVLATLAPVADSVAATTAPSASAATATAAAPVTPPPASSTNVSILSDAFFGGEFLSELTCSKCGTCSAKKEGFVEIPLALEIEPVQPPQPTTAPAASAASASSSSAASAPNAAGPLKPGMAAALQLAQTEADQPLTSLAQLGSELHTRSAATGAAVSDKAAADISKLVSSFLPSNSTDDDDASFMKDVIASTVPAEPPSAAATDAASNMAMAAMLAMAAGQVVQSTMIATAVAAAAVNSAQQANNTAKQGEQSSDLDAASSAASAASAPGTAAASDAASAPAAAAPAPPAAGVPAPAPAPKSTPAPTHVVPSGPLHLSAMLAHYFSPELLTGSNAYFCSTCQSKLTASKQLQLLTPPAHLLMCLKRNTYEFKAGRLVRNKIMKEVQYPCVLQVPVLEINDGKEETANATATATGVSASDDSSAVSSPAKPAASAAPSTRRTVLKPYVLYSVIVHSGTSAQHGHYYAISRQSDEEALAQLAGVDHGKLTQDASSSSSSSSSSSASAAASSSTAAPPVDAEVERLAQGGQWFQFNDSTVSPASFGTLANLTKTLPSDVAYLLFYRAMDEATDAAASARAAGVAAPAASANRSVDASLFQTVQSDNQRFMSELERGAQVRMALTAMEKNYTKRGGNGPEPPNDPDLYDVDSY